MPAPRTLRVTLPIPSGQLGPNGRAHWRKKHELFQEAKYEAFVAMYRSLGPVAFGTLRSPWTCPINLDVLWVVKNPAHICDIDNLCARIKPYLDAGQQVMFYENDRQVQIRSIRREVGKVARVELCFEAEEEASNG